MTQARSALESLRKTLTLVWAQSDRYVRLRLLLALLLVVAISAVVAASPLALKALVDTFTTGEPRPPAALLLLAAAYVAGQWLARALGELRGYFDAQAERRIARTLSRRMFSHILDLPLRFHLERRTGAVGETLSNGLLGLQIILAHTVYTIVPVVVELGTVAVILIGLHQAGFLAVFFVALFAYVVTFWYGMARITHAARAASIAQVDAKAIMTDSILNYETVKYFTAEAMIRNKFDRALARTEADWVRFSRRKAVSGLMISLVFGAFLTTTTAYATHQVMHGAMTVGVFVLVNAYVFQLVRPVESLGFAIQGLGQGIAYLENMLDLLAVETESTAGNRSVQGAGELRFESVSVSYRADRAVLRDVSFTLEGGKTLGIVGASGAGKSTLVRLLVRLLEPDNGQILLDGAPIAKMELQQLRRSIAVVPQDTVLFNETIGYNIAFGRPESSQAEIEEAARLARLYDFIQSLPEGYQTRVGERGVKLSGGEKQRVSIARAALKRPRIFVFDEATSSLDSRTEGEILQNLQEIAACSTTLIIAHRLSTILHADRIVVLDRGMLFEEGTHAELLAANGKYAALWRAQQRSAGQSAASRRLLPSR